MRKKLLYIALAIALISTFVVPTPVLADSPKAIKTTFQAVAQAMVTDPGKVTVLGTRIITRGEIIQGTVVATDWAALNGASLKVHHASEIKLTPTSPTTGTFAGEARALVTVDPVGGGKLVGTYKATLSGAYTLLNGQLVVNWVNDIGSIEAAGVVGGKVVKVDGTWNANLVLTPVSPGVYTLAGLAQMGGQYQTLTIGKNRNNDD